MGGWAGAVMSWAGAVMSWAEAEKVVRTLQSKSVIDQLTNHKPTERQTRLLISRVARDKKKS